MVAVIGGHHVAKPKNHMELIEYYTPIATSSIMTKTTQNPRRLQFDSTFPKKRTQDFTGNPLHWGTTVVL